MCSVFTIFPISLLRRPESELLQESHSRKEDGNLGK
jgi:hypothetical protein